jgi:hypothetical protein
MAASVVGSGADLWDTALFCELPGALSAASRLSERTGIIFAKKIRIVVSQGPHHLDMDVVDHVGAMAEKLVAKTLARGVNARAERAVKVPVSAAGLYRRAIAQAHV